MKKQACRILLTAVVTAGLLNAPALADAGSDLRPYPGWNGSGPDVNGGPYYDPYYYDRCDRWYDDDDDDWYWDRDDYCYDRWYDDDDDDWYWDRDDYFYDRWYDDDHYDRGRGPGVEGGGGSGRGWRHNSSGWWYQETVGRWPVNTWQYIDARWYRFNEAGYMVTGWFTDGDGARYYLNPVDDGTLGSMRVGWQMIDGRFYYFNTVSNGRLGALVTNTTTPDGYRVGEDGAWQG